MSIIGATGNVRETRGEVSVEWEIPDFYSLSEVGSFHQSPIFCLSDSCWSLRIYPRGKKEATDWVAMYIRREDSGQPKNVEVSFGIKKANGEEERFPGITVHLTNRVGKGMPNFISMSDLLSQKSQLTPSGALTVTCSLISATPHSAEVSLSSRLWNLSRDLWTILNEQKGTDLTLKVEGHELRAHRAILEGRCSYFAGMFGNDFQERSEIEELEEGVFRCVLSYLYTGEAEGMSCENVCKIYVAADKLHLEELKRVCTDYMRGNLSTDLICDVIVIVEMYEESELKQCALSYLNQHANELFRSRRWKKFRQRNNDLAFELLQNILLRRTQF